MAENHYPILEMQSEKVSLEEIFLELTDGGNDKKDDSSQKKENKTENHEEEGGEQ